MGRFSVDVEMANNDDLVLARMGQMPPDQVRRVIVSGVVDCGAAKLVIPEAVAMQLGLQPSGEASVRYADHRTATRKTVSGVYLSYGGRSGLFSAVVEPARESALIGAIVLEELDFLVDSTNQRLTPRDPDHIITEIE